MTPFGLCVAHSGVSSGTYIEAPAFNASSNADTAASIMWAEMELGVQYLFGMANTSEPDYTSFIVPVPLNLSTTTSARWLSDVIGINPTCSWASTNLTSPVQISTNSSSGLDQALATAYLLDFNLDVQVLSDDLQDDVTAFATVKDPTSAVTNHTTNAPPVDGSTVFLLGQCQSGCSPYASFDITLDMTGVYNTFTIASANQTWTMAILACLPNIKIETREVRNDGHGLFSVQPLPAGRQLTRQGNLNPIQTTALFSIATMSLTSKCRSTSCTERGRSKACRG
ncbi:hypothetical protein OG21DRAFT_1037027 [Imleria badia]|nr:hypothetical protein OG21DRAFT_1037027 [Imleria badia]